MICVKSHQKIVDDLINILHPRFRDIKVYLFGSRINGTGTIESDLDIFIDLGKILISNYAKRICIKLLTHNMYYKLLCYLF